MSFQEIKICLIFIILFLAPPAWSSIQETQAIKLPAPEIEGGKPLMQCLKARQSRQKEIKYL